jgi:hypothetical protein
MSPTTTSRSSKPKLPDKLEDFIMQCDAAVKSGTSLRIRYDKFLLMAFEVHRQEPKVDAALTRLGVPNKMVVLESTAKEKSWEVLINETREYMFVTKHYRSNLQAVTRLADLKFVDWIDPEAS